MGQTVIFLPCDFYLTVFFKSLFTRIKSGTLTNLTNIHNDDKIYAHNDFTIYIIT